MSCHFLQFVIELLILRYNITSSLYKGTPRSNVTRMREASGKTGKLYTKE